MVTSGEHVDAKTSLAAGLLDEIVPEGELRAGAIALREESHRREAAAEESARP